MLAVLPNKLAEDYDPSLNLDDFILSPIQEGELVARIKQAKYRVNGRETTEMLRVGDLVIDLERYDVLDGGAKGLAHL